MMVDIAVPLLEAINASVEAHGNAHGNESPVSSRRLFHGRGQHFAGLQWCSIDLYWPTYLITLFAPPPEGVVESVIERIRQLMAEEVLDASTSVVVQYRYLPGSETRCVLGSLPEASFARRENLQFRVRFNRQNSGYFLDMEPGRKWLAAHADNRSVLNLFAYTCAFSVVAVAHGAASVVNVDMSKSALQQGRENHQINALSTKHVAFLPLNILKSWSRIRKKGPYEVIVVDPPSYQKGSFIATRDYHKIAKRMNELGQSGSDALLCLNAPEIPAQFLVDTMTEFAPGWQFIARLNANEDFADVNEQARLKLLHFKKLS